MTTDQVNYLNIGLMAISLIAAFMLPFEVFLFSYAILGPLHYLTEISWLHDRNYFSPKKVDWIPLAILGLLILLGAEQIMGETITKGLNSIGMGPVTEFLGNYGYDITFMAFGLALIFVVFTDWTYRIAALIILVLAAILFMYPDPVTEGAQFSTYTEFERKVITPYEEKWTNPIYKIFGVYLPTLIHVYIFTGAFMIFGALKRNSRSGYLSFGFFILCAISCFVIARDFGGFGGGEWAQSSYGDFKMLSLHLFDDFGGAQYNDVLMNSYFEREEVRAGITEMIFTNPLSIMFARFIAFAYTYHYLNWFSKTSVIQWHKVPKSRFAVVIVAWLASIVLYIYDYGIGFRWLFLLSFLHVLLEFPLNHQSFIGIGKEIRLRISGEKKAVKT